VVGILLFFLISSYVKGNLQLQTNLVILSLSSSITSSSSACFKFPVNSMKVIYPPAFSAEGGGPLWIEGSMEGVFRAWRLPTSTLLLVYVISRMGTEGSEASFSYCFALSRLVGLNLTSLDFAELLFEFHVALDSQLLALPVLLEFICNQRFWIMSKLSLFSEELFLLLMDFFVCFLTDMFYIVWDLS